MEESGEILNGSQKPSGFSGTDGEFEPIDKSLDVSGVESKRSTPKRLETVLSRETGHTELAQNYVDMMLVRADEINKERDITGP